jgi:16S rRNA (adenine1518-N6/adenine1519-N6)-dimethyltransferase
MDYVRPKKHLGQHFLRDHNIAAKIAAGLTMHGDYRQVLEIGPGTGVLTQFLLKDSRFETRVIEIDKESVAALRSEYPDLGDRLIEGDFLKAGEDLMPEGNFAVIGNFPYNISSQILFRVLEWRDRIPEVTGMFQKEVALRIASGPRNKDYGILSVLLQAWYDIEYLFSVPPTVFVPPPKVQSGVIRLKRNNTVKLDCDEALFIRVVKTGFNQRRKTLRNALKPLGIECKDPSSPLLDLRAEALNVAEFTSLTQLFSK